jgi:hypothetical protein
MTNMPNLTSILLAAMFPTMTALIGIGLARGGGASAPPNAPADSPKPSHSF